MDLSNVLQFFWLMVAACVLDFLITIHYCYVADGKIVKATTYNWVYLLLSLSVTKYIVVVDQDLFSFQSIGAIISFATGASIGNVLAMLMRKRGLNV